MHGYQEIIIRHNEKGKENKTLPPPPKSEETALEPNMAKMLKLQYWAFKVLLLIRSMREGPLMDK